MFKGIINTDTSASANANVPFKVVRNTNANTNYDSTNNVVNITTSGYYNIFANIVASGTGTVSAQLFADGTALDSAISTEVLSTDVPTATFTLIDNVKVDPSTVSSLANVSVRFSSNVTINDAVILVEKVR